MEIYAPLADRMGMHNIRDELEDLSFKVLNNKARKLIKLRLDEIKDDTSKRFESFTTELDLKANKKSVQQTFHKKANKIDVSESESKIT